MKRIILVLAAMLLIGATAQGARRTVTEKDSLGNVKRIIELRDTTHTGESVTDTLSITTYEESSPTNQGSTTVHETDTEQTDGSSLWTEISDNIVSLTAIITIFGMPAIILIIVFYFRYKTRKAKYRLAEQALASGQPLPEGLFKEIKPEESHIKGIKNIFLGIGTFIFFWAITEEFGIGCIGLLIMFIGFGQVVTYYVQHGKDNNPFIHIGRDKEKDESHVKIDGIEISNREKNEER